MINIAIIDDDLEFCAYMKQQVEQILADTCAYRSYIFSCADQFFNTLPRHFYNILLLDIDMPGINGLDTAKILREKNSSSIIIFITSKIVYMPDAFGLNVFGFVDKNTIPSSLPNLLQKCVYHIDLNLSLLLRTNEGTINLYTNDILYAEFVNRKVQVYTKHATYSVNFTSLHLFYDLVKDKDFIYVNRSSVINLHYLKSISHKEAHLEGVEQSIPITKYQEVKMAYVEYISKRGLFA